MVPIIRYSFNNNYILITGLWITMNPMNPMIPMNPMNLMNPINPMNPMTNSAKFV